MKELLYWIVEWIAKIHSHILRLNDAYEYNFTDKELHFLVIGMMGMGFIFVVYPVFKWLEKHDPVSYTHLYGTCRDEGRRNARKTV